jgi:DNA-binding protein Fis
MSDITITGIDELVQSGQTDLYTLAIAAMDRALFTAALTHYKGNQTKVCEVLGMARATLRKKLRGLSIRAEDYVA